MKNVRKQDKKIDAVLNIFGNSSIRDNGWDTIYMQ